MIAGEEGEFADDARVGSILLVVQQCPAEGTFRSRLLGDAKGLGIEFRSQFVNLGLGEPGDVMATA